MNRRAIREAAMQRGIKRLCHFTPSRNVAHIMTDERGVLATRHLEADERRLFNPTDQERLDGYPDHVCCSIQYPNSWYFRKARQQESLFCDWVVLLLDARYLWRPATRFCPRNASASQGQLVAEGFEAFEALFAESVEGVQTYRRGSRHPGFLPTDEQAEVLIPDRVSQSDLRGFVVRDEGQAKREIARLRQLGCDSPDVLIVPEFFEPAVLSAKLRRGEIPTERVYHRGGTHA